MGTKPALARLSINEYSIKYKPLSTSIKHKTHPIQQIGEIFRLSERLKTQPRRRTEAPIEPVDTGRRDGPAQVDPDNEDMSAYYQRRNAQLSASRRPFFPPGGIH